MHPRNRHSGRYDFKALIAASPELASFAIPNPAGDQSIDFADADAVKALNRALLRLSYGIEGWDIPQGYLCPPIPGRSDYVHFAADLLAKDYGGVPPKGAQIKVLDIGVGSSCIYPIIGACEYGWSWVGVDSDPIALASSQKIIDHNPQLQKLVRLRKQNSTREIFQGIVKSDDRFDLAICNPPFHASLEEAHQGSQRKWRNLGREATTMKPPTLNFGGQGSELWCPGGEVAFILQMIRESERFRKQIRHFTSLVSKEDHLEPIYRALERSEATGGETVEMALGQKKSRFIAWTFAAH